MMAANEALQPKQFYHGTSASFKPGDAIKPNFLSDMQSQPEDRDFVWTSTKLDHADFVAQHRAKHGWHGSTTPRVYELEGTGLMGPTKTPEKGRDTHISLAPMTVKREVPEEELMKDPKIAKRRGRAS